MLILSQNEAFFSISLGGHPDQLSPKKFRHPFSALFFPLTMGYPKKMWDMEAGSHQQL